MLINDYYIYLQFAGGEAELDDIDPSGYAYITSGEVIAVDENDQKIKIGKFGLTYIDVAAAIDSSTSVFDIFDCRQDTCDYYSAIYDGEDWEPAAEFAKMFKDAVWPSNMLILDRLEILPEYRRHNLGLLVMRRLIERFGAGAAVVAIKPFPLQAEVRTHEYDEWRERLRLCDFEQDFQQAQAKLRRHYKKLGFKAMKGTPFMFRDAERPLPAPEKLQRKSRH